MQAGKTKQAPCACMCVLACMHACIYACKPDSLPAFRSVLSVCMRAHVHARVLMCMHVCMHPCKRISMQTGKHKQRETETQTDRQLTDRQTEQMHKKQGCTRVVAPWFKKHKLEPLRESFDSIVQGFRKRPLVLTRIRAMRALIGSLSQTRANKLTIVIACGILLSVICRARKHMLERAYARSETVQRLRANR